MTGRYRINVHRDPHDYNRWHGWHLVVWTCQDLKNNGLRYRTRLHLDPEDGPPHVLIEAWGKPCKKRSRPKRPRRYKPPALPTLKSLTKRRATALATLQTKRLAMNGRGQHCGYRPPLSWRLSYHAQDGVAALRERQAYNRTLGRWLAKRLASSPIASITTDDYAALDTLLGYRVRRFSELRTHAKERCKAQGGGIKGYVLAEFHNRRWHGRGSEVYAFDFDGFRQALDEFRFCDELLRLRMESK